MGEALYVDGFIKKTNRSRWFAINISHMFGIIAIKCVTEMYQMSHNKWNIFFDNLLIHEELSIHVKKIVCSIPV